MKAAVLRAYREPLTIEDLQLDDVGPREVRLRTVACGVCHSDLHFQHGDMPARMPCVLGHEPSGIVLAVGRDVTSVKPGDHVIGCVSTYCGTCHHCQSGHPNQCDGRVTRRPRGMRSRIWNQGEEVHQMVNLSAFAEEMLVHETAVVKIRPDMPMDRAALIGCGVLTGMGAVLNTGKIRPGETCAVIGCGGIGLSAIQAARIAGAGRIVAIDTMPWKLALAKKLGATDVVDASGGGVVEKVMEILPGGADFAFECIGLAETCRNTVLMVRKGGTAVFVGVVPVGVNIPINGVDFLTNSKRLLASCMGGGSFHIDMPRYVDCYLDGRLNLDDMISKRIPLEDINEAFDDLRSGKVARQVVVFS